MFNRIQQGNSETPPPVVDSELERTGFLVEMILTDEYLTEDTLQAIDLYNIRKAISDVFDVPIGQVLEASMENVAAERRLLQQKQSLELTFLIKVEDNFDVRTVDLAKAETDLTSALEALGFEVTDISGAPVDDPLDSTPPPPSSTVIFFLYLDFF